MAETTASVVDTVILGVLNVTPDSFSDGGLWIDTDAAIAHATALVAEGADLIDVGGESTRPGAERVDPIAEQRRVIPVIAALSAAGIAVSVDTMNSSTAVEAVAAGAAVVNDVSGGLADPDMAAAVAGLDVHYVAMHWRGHSKHMNELARYGDVVADVRSELAERVEALLAAGISSDRIILDPGLGFAKRAEHDWQLLGNLESLATLGHPILVGASRKRFLGALLPADAPVAERDLPTAVVSALSARAGVWGVRVHDVAGTRRALDVVRAWQGGERG
ncbi:dihydropteroate synthase [Leifsonia sp. Leaf264]|uniref:dihydropteroate synthase n=1 Tax=Leifsonia sp. Leaf264 TaxID=1736314 RepID=UPI0006FCBDB7|nr:dihydropteroate synthase [Leifsonia sp. Leaf264]KQO97524.1 dihydropteroate synthase [Leifsonia sp. Leaf264]